MMKKTGVWRSPEEVFKYALKFSDMAPADNWKLFCTLSESALSIVSQFARRGDPGRAGRADDTDEAFVELLYRWMGNGYSLAGVGNSKVEEPRPKIQVTLGQSTNGEKLYA